MNEPEEEAFSPNGSIDASIRAMLPRFSQLSQKRMIKAIRDAARAAAKQKDENSDAGARHIFREFIPAALLNSFGYNFEYECRLDGMTPDWYEEGAKLLMDSYTFERGGSAPFLKRARSAIVGKCEKYSGLAESLSSRLIVAVYLDFCTGVDLEYCMSSLPELRKVFEEATTLWGILFFTEAPGLTVSTQPYGFLCLARDNSFEEMEYWKFPTIAVFAQKA